MSHFLSDWFKQKSSEIQNVFDFYNFSRDNCSSIEQPTWQDERQEEGMRIRPRHRCSIAEVEERRVLRYSTASWRMMFPCLSMQWKVPKKNLPSLIPTNIRRNSSFLTRATRSELFEFGPSELSAWLNVFSASSSITVHLNLYLFLTNKQKKKL